MLNQGLYNPKIKPNPQIEQNEVRRPVCCRPCNLLVCYDRLKKLPIPLKQVNYNIKILRGLAIVEIDQIYSTDEYQEPIDIEYMFTVNENTVLTKMIVELGDIKVIGVVKEKEEAKQEFEKGIKEGKTMAYCEQDDNFPDIKKVQLGQLAPQRKLKVTFEYIQTLEVCFNQFWKVEVAPIIDQSYFTLNPEIGYQQKLLKKISNHVQLRERKYHFKQDFTILIDTGSKICFAKSQTHQLLFLNAKNIFYEKPQKLEIVLEDVPQNFVPFKQFTLLFATEDINTPTAILTHTNNDALYNQKYCATLSFIPKFNEVPLNDAYSQYQDGLQLPFTQKFAEYIFFIDRSGSMKGDRIKKAKQSLELFVRSLPENSCFNIISFGSVYRSMWGRSENYSQKTLDEALNHIQKMSADMNGTEIFKPLYEVIYNQDYGKHDLILNIFVLTDGEVDPKPIIGLVQKYSAPKTHVYTLGIGEGCSQYLIKRLAEVGNGKCQFVSDTNQINEQVIDLLEDSITPQLEQFAVQCTADNITRIIPNPQSILCIKKNEQFMIQILFQAEQIKEKIDFQIQFYDPQEQKMIDYSVSINLKDSINNEHFHKLAAYKYVNYYEKAQKNGDQIIRNVQAEKLAIDDQDIVDESMVHQILCSKTAFVCEVCDIEDQFKNKEREKIRVNNIKQQLQEKNERPVSSLSLAKPTYLLYMEEPKKNLPAANRAMVEKKGAPVQRMVKCRQIPKEEQEEIDQVLPIKQLDKLPQDLTYDDIIVFNQADGCFLIPVTYQAALQFERMENVSNLNQTVWNTFLSLLFLEIKCIQQRKSWQLVFQKGISYLTKKGVVYQELKVKYFEQYSKVLGIEKPLQ